MATQLKKKLANEFSKVLSDWLSKDELQKVVSRNKKETSNACHSHDFCDANMAILKALHNTGLTSKETDLINEAWNLAKENNFSQIK